MGDNQDPEAEGQAPENRALTWACFAPGQLRSVYFANQDLSDGLNVVCKRLDELEFSLKAGWYITRSLRQLEEQVAKKLLSLAP